MLETRSARLEFRVLGALEIVGAGGAVRPTGEKPAAVLAFLALHPGEIVSRDRLVDSLWGDDPPATAAAALQMHVAKVRNLLDEAGGGRSRLTTRGAGYVLHVETDELDAWRFRALAAEGRRVLNRGDAERAATLLSEALGLWRGGLLDGLGPLGFVEVERARFRELRLGALEDSFDAQLQLGHHAEVAAELEHAVAEEPHRDRLRELAMLALYRCGRQADALALYRSGRELLNDELGLDPSPGLRRLEQAILRHDPSLELPARRREAGRFRGRKRVAAAVITAAVVLAFVAGLTGYLTAGGAGATVVPNSVAVLDSHGRVAADVIAGTEPSALAVGASRVWALNLGDGTVTRIDPATLQTGTVGVGSPATALAFGDGALWVGTDRGLLRVDPTTGQSSPVSLGRDRTHTGVLAPRGVSDLSGGDRIWATGGNPSRLFRITADGQAHVQSGSPALPAGQLVYAAGSLWSAAAGTLTRLDPETGATSPVAVDSAAPNGFGGQFLPQQVARGSGFVWVTAPYEHAVVAVAPRTLDVAATGRIAGRPISVAYGLGAVWVGTEDGTISRVDPATATVTKTVHIGGPVSALAVADGRVWAAVAS